MKIVVTGATGFVGKWFVDELLRKKVQVTVLVRDTKKMKESWKGKANIVVCEMNQYHNADKDQIGKADLFFHFAWCGTSGETRADERLQLKNIEYSCQALYLAKRLDCKRFIFAGSIMEYEAMQTIPKEKMIPGEGTIYSTAKLTADFMLKALAGKLGVEYVNAIISNIYGPGEESMRFFNTILRKMIKNEMIPLTSGTQLYDFIYVEDAVKAIYNVGVRGEAFSGYYIGNEKRIPLKEFVIRMKEVVKSQSSLQFGAIEVTTQPLDYDLTEWKELKEVNFTPTVSFEEGVQKTREWMGKSNE